MAVTTNLTNKPLNPRGQDQSPKGYNRAELYTGKALDFDGVNDSVIVSQDSSLELSQGSWSCWFNIDTFGNYLRIIQKGHNAGSNCGYGIALSNASNVVDFWFRTTAGTEQVKQARNLETNTWYFATGTFDGTYVKVYINGIEVTEDSSIINYSAADTTLTIGMRAGNVASPFDGEISGVRVFNTALTAAQVADLYNNPEKIVPTGVDNDALKLWLPMQEGAGTTAYDGSGNGNHGTISGATYTHGIGAPVAQTAVIDWNKGTNKLVNSTDLDTYWSYNETSVDTGYLAPNGSNTAFKVTKDSGATSPYAVLGGVVESDDYRAIWARTTSGTGTANLLTYGGNTNNLFTITEEWQKFSIDSTTIGTASTNFYLVDFRFSSSLTEVVLWQPHCAESESVLIPTIGTAQTSDVLLPAGLTTGRDITGVNLFENVRKQGALNLDGNSWAEVHDNSSLDYSSEVTLESWVYWTGEIDKAFLGKWHGPDSERSLILYAVSVDEVSVYYSSNGTTTAGFINASQTLSAGNWYHFVFTSDGSTIKIYVDAVEGNSAAYSGGFYISTKNLEIGTYQTDEDKAYNGQIAQPRIYNRALTAEEVERNYNAGKNTYTN